MDTDRSVGDAARSAGDAAAPADRRRLVTAVGAGLAACVLMTVVWSPRYSGAGGGGGVGDADNYWRGVGFDHLSMAGVIAVLLPLPATLIGLLLARHWSYLMLAGGLLGLPSLVDEVWLTKVNVPLALYEVGWMGPTLLLLGVLGCAQAIARGGAPGWAAAVAGCAFGAQIAGAALGKDFQMAQGPITAWHVGMTAVGLVVVIACACRYPRWDSSLAFGDRAARDWLRIRYLVTGVLVVAVQILLTAISLQTLARLLGVGYSALSRHEAAVAGIVGVITVVIAIGLAAVSGVWCLAGALTAGVIQIALTAPLILALLPLAFTNGLGWAVALTGVAAGAAAAVSRWRVPLAAGTTVLAGVSLFVAYAATTGDPAKIVEQRQVVPATMLLVVLATAGTATVGATVTVLARRAAVPVILGPVVAMLAVGGRQVLQSTYVGSDGEPDSTTLNPIHHLTTSATLLLVAAAALGGLALAETLAARRADQRLTEAVRREAAEAERRRLARPIHDGVLQVLSLVQRHGPELGDRGAELAELAGVQEVALRALLSAAPQPGDHLSAIDLRMLLAGIGTPSVEVAMPAEPVVVPAHAAQEMYAAVTAAIDNVRRHAGQGAHAWILVERETDGVRITVRDDGAGMAPGRLDEAAAAGRLGVAQSIRGRIADLGGTTTITSNPGEGTEVEFWVPVA